MSLLGAMKQSFTLQQLEAQARPVTCPDSHGQACRAGTQTRDSNTYMAAADLEGQKSDVTVRCERP